MNFFEIVIAGLSLAAAQEGADTSADVQANQPVCHKEDRKGPSEAETCDIQLWARAIQENYPVEAIRNNWEGAVKFRLTITPEGRVSSCDIVSSSGHAVLDNAACESLLAHATFYPALDEDGQAIAGSHTSTVRYSLPDGPPPSFADLRPQPGGDPLPKSPETWLVDLLSSFVSRHGPLSANGPLSFSMEVDASGAVTQCEISGAMEQALKDELCAGFLETGRFYPALNAEGEPVAGTFTNN